MLTSKILLINLSVLFTILVISASYSPALVYAQETVPSNIFCTKVGNPTQPNPCPQIPSTQSAQLVPPGQSGDKPVAPSVEASELRQKIIDQFGITMNGFDAQYLQWAWEKFWEVSNTKFNEFVRGSIIGVTSSANTQQIGCPGGTSVLLGQFGDGNTWKHVLIHELGHVIRNCNARENTKYNEHLGAFSQESGVSDYGNKAPSCTGSDNHSEDYAEMIAYYLNPGYQVSTVKCFSPQNPNLQANFPVHYIVARQILGDY